MTALPILEAHDLVRHFTAQKRLFRPPSVVRAVDGVTFAVERGETFAIVGESGCGKSTLARLLVGLLQPSGGTIHYQGTDIGLLSGTAVRRLRREIQLIFQDPFSSLNPRMTIGSIVGEPLRVHGIGARSDRRTRVFDLLRRVGLLPEHADRYPFEFSGGQRQRIGIARALACGPKLLIGDEPVSALDVSVQAQVVNLLEDLKEEFGLTLVLIAHDLAVVRHMSDRIGVMYLGELVELAPTDSLYERPLHPYSQALLQSIPVPAPRSRAAAPPLSGDVPSPLAPPPGCRFHTRCPHARPRCRTERPILTAADERRFVACHFWREIEAPRFGPRGEPNRTDGARQRFDLFKKRRQRHEAVQGARRDLPRSNQKGETANA